MANHTGKYRTETRGRKPNGEISLALMQFGYALLECGGVATDAYRKTHPKCNEDAAYIRWKAFKLKNKLFATNWFQNLLDEKGLTNEKIADKLSELLNAENIVYFQKDGVVKGQRKTPDNKTRLAATRLVLESKKLLTQKAEIDANVNSNTPETFVAWLKKESAERNGGEQEETGDGDDA